MKIPASGIFRFLFKGNTSALNLLHAVLMQGFLTTDGHKINTDGFDSLDQLLQEVY